jgi:hypothetical protein
VKAVERRDDSDPCTTPFADRQRQRFGKGRLAGTRRAGDPEQEPTARRVDRRVQLVRQAWNERVRVAPRLGSRRPRD